MSSRGSWSRRGPGETRACWRRRALDSDSTLDSISVGLVAGTVTPNWPWERKRSQLSGAGERRCTSVASSCGPPSWAAWSEVWMPRASFEVTGGWGWVRCLATWLNVGQTLAQPRLQSLECGRVQKRKTSNQQPATSNQQPATSNQQPTTTNTRVITSFFHACNMMPYGVRKFALCKNLIEPGQARLLV